MIEKQLQLIDLEMSCVDTAVPQELSGEEIEIIKKGWGEAASGIDILVCAQTFMDIGRYPILPNVLYNFGMRSKGQV